MFWQEAVYHCLPDLWLRRVFPGVIYANTNIPEKRCKILHSQQEISELPDKSEVYLRRICLTDIWTGQMKSFKMENLLQSVFYVKRNFLDTTMFLLYQMKMIGSLWNLLMTC